MRPVESVLERDPLHTGNGSGELFPDPKRDYRVLVTPDQQGRLAQVAELASEGYEIEILE